jgi:hypothetical protein
MSFFLALSRLVLDFFGHNSPASPEAKQNQLMPRKIYLASSYRRDVRPQLSTKCITVLQSVSDTVVVTLEYFRQL